MRNYLYLICLLLPVAHTQTASAHAGVDHNNSCFIEIADTRLRISGYQFETALEGKHFCHFFPELGQIALTIEPMQSVEDNSQIHLELAQITSWLEPNSVRLIKQQPAQEIKTGAMSISAMINQRGLYQLNTTLERNSVKIRHSFIFMVGVPITKIMISIAGLLILVLVYFGLTRLKLA